MTVATRALRPLRRNPLSARFVSKASIRRRLPSHVIHSPARSGDRIRARLPTCVGVRGREQVDSILLQRGVLDIKRHRSLRTTVGRLVEQGHLVRVLPAVYARKSEAQQVSVLLAALFAWAPKAVLIGDSARAIATGTTPRLPLTIALPSSRKPPRWIRVARRRVAPESIRRREGIRFASAAWVAVEAAARDGGEELFDVLRESPGLTRDLSPILSEFRGASASRVRNQIVRECESNPHSVAEHRLHNLLRSHGIDGWTANQALWVDDHKVIPDAYFPDARLAIEFDSWAYHSSRQAFERDRLKQLRLLSVGISTLRITWEMLADPDQLVSLIRSSLHAAQHAA